MGKTVETKRKKGRPSLLDLQKRSLRLQQQQQKGNPNPNPNPYLRFPNTGAGTRCRSTRRNPIIEPVAELHDDGEEDDGNIGKRREKKLKLVLRIDGHSENSPSHSGPSGSESEENGSGSRRKRKIETFDGDEDRLKVDMHSSLKTMESLRAEASNSGPTTTLPDKKLLLIILDMLQKRDTYGVFSEPVDPEELPDYHEVIEHPMDFSTVRKKLSRGAYKNLEQFEKDVFLISSNAMRYNATDTIYYRQARSIQDLAKKNFESLRQKSDREPELKTVVRRGRPPSKNINRPVAPLPSEPAASGFPSGPTQPQTNAIGGANLSNQTHPLSKKGSVAEKPGLTDVSRKVLYGLRSPDSFCWMNMNKVDASDEFTGFARGFTARFDKKAPVMEENRRNTYSEFQPYSYGCELPIWSLFDGEKKQLAAVRTVFTLVDNFFYGELHTTNSEVRDLHITHPKHDFLRMAHFFPKFPGGSHAGEDIELVGLHIEHAYARSLARFAAQLGSIGWAIASKKIEKALPAGTKFGRGWVGADEIPEKSRPQTQSSSSLSNHSSQALISPCTTILKGNNKPSHKVEPSGRDIPSEGIISKSTTMASAPPDPRETDDNETVVLSKTPFQLHRNRLTQPTANGFAGGFRFSLPSQAGNLMKPMKPPPVPFGSEPPMTHARPPLDTAPRNINGSTLIRTHSSHFDSDQGNDSQWRAPSTQAKMESVPPDLNIRFQSPGSPVSGARVVDPQQPDLALQL